jgi:hypothetical protein
MTQRKSMGIGDLKARLSAEGRTRRGEQAVL